MRFEWDEKKNQLNIAKHGIQFTEASSIFSGDIITRIDDRIDYGEIRKISIGSIEGIIIVVVIHTDRDGIIRIISARKANKKEVKIYHEHIRQKN